MIKQNDGRLREEIQHYGCYYMSLLYISNHYTNLALSAELINEGLYSLFCKRGWMVSGQPVEPDGEPVRCWIADPLAILRWAGLDLIGMRKAPGDHRTLPMEIEILFWKRPGVHGHFTVGDGHGHCTYDPWYSPEGGSLAVRRGAVESKRIFLRR